MPPDAVRLQLRVVGARVEAALELPSDAPPPVQTPPPAAPPSPPREAAPAPAPMTPTLSGGAAAALCTASDVAASLRAERAALVAQLQCSESSRAVTQLTAQLAAERSARFHEELLLRSELASLQAERDTLAARVATLERERAQSAELARRPANCAAPSADPASATWLPWLFAAAPRATHATPEAALAAVQHHLVTVTTDRDLLAADLYRAMLESGTAQRERDAALGALRDATAQLARIASATAPAGATEAG